MVQAMRTKVGNPLRKLVLIKLADNANDDGECWPSYQHIADQCEIARSTVKLHIRALESAGLLRREFRRTGELNQSNVFHLTLGGGAADNPPGAADNPGGGAADNPRTSHSLEPVNEPKKRAASARVCLTVADLVQAGVKEQHAIDWMEIRNKKRAPLTRTAAEALAREATKAGITIPEAVKICAERGWQGFKSEWLVERKTAQEKRSERNARAFDYEYQMQQLDGV